MNTTAKSTTTRSFLAVVLVGLAAGVLADIAMLVTMGILRLAFGWPTPTELIFDRLFPYLTVEFFISSLVKAGGYTPLKLQGVYGALAGQAAVAAIGGVIYSWYLNRLERRQDSDNAHDGIVDARGWRLIVPGVLVATVLFVVLLWPMLIANYHGLPPAQARIVASLEMLISFSVCGFGIMLFHAVLSARADDSKTWNQAEISEPGTKISWSLWRYEWTPKAVGESRLVVRATDGEGKLQISEYRDQVPDGATGLHSVRANVVAS